jgi:hypothetical protein
MAKKIGAQYGNKNAEGGRGGIRTAVFGSFIGGPIGAFGGGMYTGAFKNQRAMTRHATASTLLGMTGGALVGTAVMPVIGTAVGGLAGGISNYAFAKGGQAMGKHMSKNRRR